MWEAGPHPISFPSPWSVLPTYPADEGGIGEGGPHVMELEVIHVVEELCRGGEESGPILGLLAPSPILQSTQLKSLANSTRLQHHGCCAQHWTSIISFTVVPLPLQWALLSPEFKRNGVTCTPRGYNWPSGRARMMLKGADPC